MRNIWIIWVCVAVAFLTEEKVRVTAQSLTDDLYLEDQSSGDYPIDDDEDFASGSGSGEGPVEKVNVKTMYIVPEAQPTKGDVADLSSRTETISFRYTPRIPARTEAPILLTEEPSSTDEVTSTTSAPQVVADDDKPFRVHSENILQRTEVLAAVIAGGVIGLLFAIFLILFLVYRMRKKDEGSYDLGERKPISSAYQKAPTKEFYA
ncbi:hypothetical protein GJAV_G00017340 [Gymnothorax javanicus]|nr:hypothetical protein GJAV_G00017340 [Gymnothorax javanicus]